jgi:hypothetical protein
MTAVNGYQFRMIDDFQVFCTDGTPVPIDKENDFVISYPPSQVDGQHMTMQGNPAIFPG